MSRVRGENGVGKMLVPKIVNEFGVFPLDKTRRNLHNFTMPMHAFTVRWRSARQHREHELYTPAEVGACLITALRESGGESVWDAGTLWKCPGCGDRTLKIEEFVEGIRLAESYLQEWENRERYEGKKPDKTRQAALRWLAEVALKSLGCERDRVYLKDEDGECRFAGETFISRI